MNRRSRWERDPDRNIQLTPPMIGPLLEVGRIGFLLTHQVQRLVPERSEKSIARSLRRLFDGGLLDNVAVPRMAVDADAPNDHTLLHGSAPNLYLINRAGGQVLVDGGHLDELPAPPPSFGPKNALFLRHELAVRDVYVWARRLAHQAKGALHFTPECPILHGTKPDALFKLPIQNGAVRGFVECDMGTERLTPRWASKVAGYARILAEAPARVLVVAPDKQRCWELSQYVREQTPAAWDHFWFASFSLVRKDEPGRWLHNGEGEPFL